MTPIELFEYFLETDFRERLHDFYRGISYSTVDGLSDTRLDGIISDLKERYEKYTALELRDRLQAFDTNYFPELLDIILVETPK